jgi:hypothetical protein
MLTQVAANLWCAEHTLSFPGRVQLPSRMTVVRLPTGEVLLHSPVPPAPALAEAVHRLGPVRFVLAPSCLHHLFVGPWLERHPEARLYGSRGLTYEEFVAVFRDGRRKDGRPLDAFMPTEALRNLKELEMRALWAYLQSVPPRPFGER